jgi:hypothetical protein
MSADTPMSSRERALGIGLQLAQQLFAKRGKHCEAHLAEAEVAALCVLAIKTAALETAAASSNPSATDNVSALRFLARWYEGSKGFPGADHGQIVTALNESAVEIVELRGALAELHAQVDQIRVDLGLYRYSPSMHGAMARAEAALRPPPKMPAPSMVARFKGKRDDNYVAVDLTDPNTLERYSLATQKAGETLAQEISELWAFLNAGDGPESDDECGPSP